MDEVVVGVVSAPQLNRRWWASKDGGAWTQVSRLGSPLVNEVVIGITDGWLETVLQADVSILVHVAYFALSMTVYVATFVLTAWFLRIPELEQSVAKLARRIPASLRNRLFR